MHPRFVKTNRREIIFHTPEKAPIRTSTEGTSTETSAKNSHQSSSAKSQLFLGYLPQYSTIDRKFPISVEEVILSGLSIQKSLTSRFTPRTERERQTDYRPHGIRRARKPLYRTIKRWTTATCPVRTCHHLGSCSVDS